MSSDDEFPSLPPLPKKAKPEHLPSDDLSPRLKKIISRDYDYPYRKGHEYLDDEPIYDKRRQINEDNYDNYTAKALEIGQFTGGSSDFYFGQDPQMAELAAKIDAGQDIPDLDLEAVKDRINKRYSNNDSGACITLLGFADADNNLRAVDKLFKHGASPYVLFDDRPGERWSFFSQMWSTLHPGFNTDVTRLYTSYGFDPNYPNATWGTFLGSMINLENELGWVALMEAGANPWARFSNGVFHEEKSIAANVASGPNSEFIDYMLWKRHYFTDPKLKPEWVYELLYYLTSYYSPRNDLQTRIKQRQARAILELTRLKPSDKVLEFINYKPKPRAPEGYGDSPKFN